MIEKEHFIKRNQFEITAATIGINKEDWFSYKPGDDKSEIILKMQKEKYDIVPINNKFGKCTSYFTLNDDKLNTSKIADKYKIYYLTHIRDVIWSMVENDSKHFFLTNGRNENDIVGLISLSNFNNRDFYIYLFNSVSFLEVEFARLIESEKTEAFEILNYNANSKEQQAQLTEILNRIKEDENNGIDNNYKEYLYFSHFITLIIAKKIYISLDYKSVESFEKNIGILKLIRNTVAHPVKSLIRNSEDLVKLNKGISKIYELKEKLSMY